MSNNFSQPMRVMNSEMSKLQTAAQKLSSALGNTENYSRLNESLKAQATRLESLKANYRTASEGTERMRQKTAQLALQHEQAKQRVQQYSATLPKNSMLLMFAKKREQELAQAYRESQKDTQRLTAERDKLYRQIGTAEDKLSGEKQQLQEMGDALRSAGVNTDNLREQQERLRSSLERVTNAQNKLSAIREKLTWGNIKGDILKSAAAIKTFEVPIRVNMDFEQAMAQVRAVLNPTREEFLILENQAKELGRTTQFSATQAANSQENLARAGFTVDKIIAMMPEVLNVAAADGMELAQAADIVGGTLRGFNLKADEAKRITDILAYTSSNSATNVTMAGAAMQGFSGTAALQNITPERAAAYIGVLAQKTTLQGQEASTLLERALTALAMRKGDTGKVLDQYGIATKSKGGRMRTLESVALELYEKSMKRGDTQNAFMRVFGKAYGGDMLKFVAGVREGQLDNLMTGLESKKDGAAAKMTLSRNDTLKGDLTSLSSAWEGLMIKIGEALTPINRFFVQTLTTGIQKFTAFLTQNRELCDWAIRIGYALAGWMVISKVFKYGKLIFQLIGAWGEVANATKAAGEAIGFIPSLIGKITAAFSWLGSVIMAHPLLALAALVSAVVVAVIMNWDKVKAWWDAWVLPNIWEPIKNFASETVEVLKQTWEDFKTWLLDKFANLNPFNWEFPSWLGGGTVGTNKQQVHNAEAALSGYQPPAIRAQGGIITRPEIALIGEAGQEAVIPLTKRTRGLEVLSMAAETLGASITPHAEGGILTRPHMGLVAEAGAEAVIPLTDKGKGIPLLMQAAHMLGLQGVSSSISSQTSSLSLKELAGNVRNYSVNQGSANSINNYASSSWPQVNLTVNVDGRNSDEEGLAERIAAKVREVLGEIMSLEERVSYA